MNIVNKLRRLAKTLKGLVRSIFKTDFELACIVGVVVIVSDMAWLTHDIVHNGFNAWYICIGIGMCIGLLGTLYVIIRHSLRYTRKVCAKTLKTKLDKLQRLHKRQGISHNPRAEKLNKEVK